MNSSLSLHLRTSTADAHVQAEKSFPLFRDSFTSHAYGRLLQTFVPVFEAYESALRASGLPVPHLEERLQRTAWLKSDLQALGLWPMTSVFSLSIRDAAEMLGALYVIEGSSLGGQVIAKRLHENLGLGEDKTAFYRSYGADTGKLWQELKGFLDSQELNDEQRASAVHGARTLFGAMENAMNSVSPTEPVAAV